MKNFTKSITLILLILTVASCGKGEPENTAPTPTPKPNDKIELSYGTDTNPTIPTDGGTITISFNASTAWTAQAVNDRANTWCTISPTRGNAGIGNITITSNANTEPNERSASINIKAGTASQTIRVTQKQKDALTVTASTIEVPAEGKDISIEVKANINVTYKIDQQCESWIKYISTKAIKSSTLLFGVSKNESLNKREGKIIIGEGEFADTIKIFQAGETPSIVLNKEEYVAKSEGETFAIEVTSNIDVNISILYPDAAPTWLQEHKTKTMSTNTYYFTAAPNEGYDNREAKIIFTNKSNNLSDTVKVIQSQKNIIILAHNRYNIDNNGGQISVRVASNIKYSVDIDASWITQIATKSLVSDTLVFDIQANESDTDREAIIKFISDDKKITQSINIVQSTNYYIPTLIWGQSTNQVKEYMKKYNLLFEDESMLIYENKDPYIVIAYNFAYGKLFQSTRYNIGRYNENGILVRTFFKVMRSTHEDFVEVSETSTSDLWSESTKTYFYPFFSTSSSKTKYEGYTWFCTKYME